jgi:hypothetical protein
MDCDMAIIRDIEAFVLDAFVDSARLSTFPRGINVILESEM